MLTKDAITMSETRKPYYQKNILAILTVILEREVQGVVGKIILNSFISKNLCLGKVMIKHYRRAVYEHQQIHSKIVTGSTGL